LHRISLNNPGFSLSLVQRAAPAHLR
jgi:hypothetical protein